MIQKVLFRNKNDNGPMRIIRGSCGVTLDVAFGFLRQILGSDRDLRMVECRLSCGGGEDTGM